jgi:8-oxo-dGTP diphosphatase
MTEVHKAGLIHFENGRILLCRKKRSTSLLILPGGKLEKGETAEECLRRECKEELGDVEIVNLRQLGTYESSAAEDEAKVIRIELFAGELRGTPAAHAEIQELVWFGPQDDPGLLAPSLRNIILPDLRGRGLVGW